VGAISTLGVFFIPLSEAYFYSVIASTWLHDRDLFLAVLPLLVKYNWYIIIPSTDRSYCFEQTYKQTNME